MACWWFLGFSFCGFGACFSFLFSGFSVFRSLGRFFLRVFGGFGFGSCLGFFSPQAALASAQATGVAGLEAARAAGEAAAGAARLASLGAMEQAGSFPLCIIYTYGVFPFGICGVSL